MFLFSGFAKAGDFEQALSLLDRGEKELDGPALVEAEGLLVKECQGPSRDPLCEYYLARTYLAQYNFLMQVKRDVPRALQALGKAEATGKGAVARRPNDAEAHALLGRIYQAKLAQYPITGITQTIMAQSPVVSEYERALQLNPNLGSAELGLGIYYQFMPRFLGGNGHLARKHFWRAAMLMSGNPEPLAWICASYREEGRLLEAREYLNRALAIDPNNRFVQAEGARLKAMESLRGSGN